MGRFLRYNFDNLSPFIKKEDLKKMENEIIKIDREKISGGDTSWTGWESLPDDTELNEEREKIIRIGKEIIDRESYLVVIGIGGSYLGAKAVISAFQSEFSPTKVIFAGFHMDGKYLKDLCRFLDDKDFYINVISKSGTTLEPAISFRVLRRLLEKKYSSEEVKNRIICTTDKKKGLLKGAADKNSYRRFTIPDNIGGRFSVLTPVGLLPLAAAGISISGLIKGASSMRKSSLQADMDKNFIYQYAAIRHLLYQNGKSVEILSTFHPYLSYFAEWWKQLFGESEGKEGKGLFPASCVFSTDLHSLGQWIQEGPRNIFETFIEVENEESVIFPKDDKDEDQLNYLAGRNISEINDKAREGTLKAHSDGKVPCSRVILSEFNEKAMGELIYFFEKTTAINGYLLGVNPFNQPGVEAYKKNMFQLLGKPV